MTIFVLQNYGCDAITDLVFQQDAHYVNVAVFRTKVQGRISTVIASIDIASTDQQKLNGFNVALPHSVMKWPQTYQI